MEPCQRGQGLCPCSKYLCIRIFCDKTGIGGLLITVSDSSSLYCSKYQNYKTPNHTSIPAFTHKMTGRNKSPVHNFPFSQKDKILISYSLSSLVEYH